MPPIGLGYLQSFLIEKNINAEILDLNNIFYNLSNDKLKKEWLISCNLPLEKNILSIIKADHPKKFNDLIDRISSYDVAGFSCFKSNFKSTLEVARLVRYRRKDIKLVLGGPEVTRQFFRTRGKFGKDLKDSVDFLVVGEGEPSFYNYLTSGHNNDKVSSFQQLKDLEDAPFPKYAGLDFDSYPRRDALPMQFSRGCIRKCSFCSERLLYKGFRTRKIDSIIEEIKYYKINKGINYFVFFDSLIDGNLRKLEEFCDKIIDEFGSINWEAQMAIRGDMESDIFEKMKKSGCYNLFIGLESGSDLTLEHMRKGFTVKQAAGFFRKLKDAGLSFGISVIVGYPGETDAEFQESLNFIIQNKEIIPKIEQINPFTYYDGTDSDKSGDYKINKRSLKRLDVFVKEIKRNNFKYTNAFLGNLIEKNDRV